MHILMSLAPFFNFLVFLFFFQGERGRSFIARTFKQRNFRETRQQVHIRQSGEHCISKQVIFLMQKNLYLSEKCLYAQHEILTKKN